MSEIDSIVVVNIDVQQDTLARTSFGIPGVFGQFLTSETSPAFSRAREYADMAAMEADGWTPADEVHKMATAVFSQNPRPAKIVVGRRDAADASWDISLAAIQAENDSWYGFSVVPVGADAAAIKTELTDLATWTETRTKIFFAQHSEAGILAIGTTTDLGSVLQDASRRRTALFFREDTYKSEYAPAASFAENAPYKPGSSTYNFKTLAGCTASPLKPAEKTSAHSKSVNTYTSVAGQKIVQKGVVSSGEFIDVIVFIDWLTVAIQEAIFAQLVATRKVSYDDPGIVSVASVVQGVLEEGVRNGGLQAGSISLTIPKYKDIPVIDRTARKLTGIKFSALLAGAVHECEINGTVSV